MSLKNRMYISLVCAIVLSAVAFTFLVIGYLNGFHAWATLCLLFSVVAMVAGWAWYYLCRTKFKEFDNPHKKKYYGKGNRKNRRRGG